MTDLAHDVRFLVEAEASPGLLGRLLEPLAKRDLVPDAVTARREGEAMHLDVLLHSMPAGMVHLVAGNMGQVIGTLAVRVAHGAAQRRAA